MGEVACSECGKQISEFASVCEHCGEELAKSSKRTVSPATSETAEASLITNLSDIELLKILQKITPIKNASDETMARKEWERRNLPLAAIEKLKAQLSQLSKKDKNIAKSGSKTCPSCNKANNPSFVQCWNCSAELGGGAPSTGLSGPTESSAVKMPIAAMGVRCQQCGAVMKKTTKYEADMAAQQLGCILALVGIVLLFFFPFGTIVGIVIILGEKLVELI